MSIKGFNINGQVQRYDYNALENLPQDSGGLSAQAKQALLACFRNVAWVNANGQTYYDALETALTPATMYSITNNLTGCTTSNYSASIAEGSTYTATITASSGYTLEGATATATMGGQSVTGFYNNGTISIPNVTGNLVITVTATSAIVSISAVFTQGQAVIYENSSINTLRQYLTVTATYADSTTETVTDYTLSGTLTVGASTITVAYGGKMDTFNVTVTEHEPTSDMNGWTDGVAYTNITIVENQYCIANSGKLANYNGWDRTGYVPCNGASTIVIPPMPQEGTAGVKSNWFFRQDKTPLSAIPELSRTASNTRTVPADAYYFILSSNTDALISCLNNGVVPHA